MKIKLPMTVLMDDGRTLSVVADQREYAAAEAADDSVPGMAGAHTRARFMAHHALRRTGQYPGTFETFNRRDCVEVETHPEESDDADEGLDPGRSAPSAVS